MISLLAVNLGRYDPPMRRVLSAALLLTTAACGSTPVETCADCTGCGIAGPATPGAIDIVGPGVDSGGLAAVDLYLQEGDCQGQDVVKFRASYNSGTVTVTSAEALTPLDTSKVTYDADLHTWTDRDLTLSTSAGGLTVELTFTEVATSTSVTCSAANRVVTCTPK